MHSTAMILKNRLGHECCCFIMLFGYILNDVFVLEDAVRRLDQRPIAHVDLALAARGDFVVVPLDGEPRIDHHPHHFRAEIVVRIGRRAGEIPLAIGDL